VDLFRNLSPGKRVPSDALAESRGEPKADRQPRKEVLRGMKSPTRPLRYWPEGGTALIFDKRRVNPWGPIFARLGVNDFEVVGVVFRRARTPQ